MFGVTAFSAKANNFSAGACVPKTCCSKCVLYKNYALRLGTFFIFAPSCSVVHMQLESYRSQF